MADDTWEIDDDLFGGPAAPAPGPAPAAPITPPASGSMDKSTWRIMRDVRQARKNGSRRVKEAKKAKSDDVRVARDQADGRIAKIGASAAAHPKITTAIVGVVALSTLSTAVDRVNGDDQPSSGPQVTALENGQQGERQDEVAPTEVTSTSFANPFDALEDTTTIAVQPTSTIEVQPTPTAVAPSQAPNGAEVSRQWLCDTDGYLYVNDEATRGKATTGELPEGGRECEHTPGENTLAISVDGETVGIIDGSVPGAVPDMGR